MNSPILESKQKSEDNPYGITSGLFLNRNIPKASGITVGINVINSQSNLKTVSMTCNTENAIIRYTLDYADPTEESTEYINEIEVEAPITIKARGYKEGWIDSDVEVETIIGYLPKPEMIIKTDFLGDTYAVLQNVDSYPEDALVYYSRTNNPFEGTNYMSILTIKNALIKGAIAILTIALPTLFVGVSCCDCYNSDIGDITGQVVATPIITQSGNNITIVCSTPNSTIYYTTDGTDPAITSNLYGEIFTISTNCTIKAIAVADGYITSAIASRLCTYTVIPPVNWVAISDMKLGSNYIGYVGYGDGKFVAVAYENADIGAYSEDGITWTAINYNFNQNNLYDVFYGNRKFVICSQRGHIFYSEDAVNWNMVTVGDTRKFNKMRAGCYGGGKFVVISTDSGIAYSEDAINWKTTVPPSNFYDTSSICYGDGKFVAVNSRGKGMYSEDGINWVIIDDMNTGSTDITSVCYGNGRFVAVTYDGKGAYSEDGINWTTIDDMKVSVNGRDVNAVCYGNGKFVVVGYRGISAYSEDGINWTLINSVPPFGQYDAQSDICYGNDKFVAVGKGGKGSYCIA